jgi:prepilin peptidase CpaA
MNPLQISLLCFLGCVVVLCALMDLRVRRLPNVITYPTMLVALACHACIGGVEGLIFSAEGLVLGMAFFTVPYLMGGMGAGDVKLMGAVGAVLGSEGVFWAAVMTGIAGGLYSIMLLIKHREYTKDLSERLCMTAKVFYVTGKLTFFPASQSKCTPILSYGVAISFGTLCYIAHELFKPLMM